MKRLIIDCPESNLAVMSNVTLADVLARREVPLRFACPCGKTHEIGLRYRSRIWRAHGLPEPHCASLN